ncbi:MAG TPA: hypothetical protein VN419_12725 [Humidesulfovibrio sp.]|uniref:hypothetical protein n=1 Tax=Humidesulfovibrio sp. TaxID=2910988 RepID=UPI002B61BE81|nr:hypothetical protein [Humidesulfovibrio sp.]HWR04861.1 hypothetical protein [Humidesulfovibrio sp.]
MSDPKQSKHSHSKKHKILLRVLWTLCFLLGLSAAVLLALPGVISSDWARSQVERQLAAATGNTASLKALSFSWTDGLRLRDLRLGQGELADPAFLASLESLHADLSLLPLLHRDLRLNLELHGLRLHVPHAEPAAEPPHAPKPLSEVLRAAFASLRKGLVPSALGLDAHLNIDLADMAVRLEPAPGGKALELRDMAFKAAVQGLASSPVTVEAALQLFTDGALTAPLRFTASLDQLLDASGRLNPAQAVLSAQLNGPGLELRAGGSLAKTLKIDLRAQPGVTLNALRPLAASPLPQVDGAVALSLSLSQPTQDTLALAFLFFGDGLRARGDSLGGPLAGKTAGPLSLNLLQEAELDLKSETARLPGSLDIRPTSALRWVAGLSGVAQGKPRVTFSLAPAHLALHELLPALRAFLPPGLDPGSPSLDIEALELAADLPDAGDTGSKAALSARVKGLEVKTSNANRRDASGSLSVGLARLRMDSARLELPGTTPGQAEAVLSASLDDIRLGGKTPVSVGGFALQRLELHADRLTQDAAALFGLAGTAAMEMEAQAKSIEVKGKAAVAELRQSLRLTAELPPAKSARLNLERLAVDAPVLRVLQPGKKHLETPFSLRASAPDISLSGPEKTPALRDLRFALDLGRALRCEGTASLDGPNRSGGRGLRTSGNLNMDAQQTLALAQAFAPRQAKASGSISADWTLAATLPPPAPAAQASQSATPKKLSQTLRELNFMHQADLVLRLGALSLDWPLVPAPGQPAETLHLRGVSTPRPLHLAMRDGVAETSLAGSVAFGPMDALPGVGRLGKPLRGLLTLNARQQGARSAQLSQMLHLDGLELDQNLALTLDKLDLVLDRDADRLAAALELMDASLNFSLAAGLDALPAKAAAVGMSGKGRLEAGADVRLAGGRSLALSARFLSPGLDLRLGPDTEVSGLASSLRLSRRFSLQPGLRCPGELEATQTPLSEQVFDLFPSTGSRAPSADVALGQLVRADATRATAGTFSLARLTVKSAGLPLTINDVQLRLDDSGPVPGLRSFRAGLLGGNVLGSAMLRKNAGRYALEADMAFTGIDPGRLLPDKAPRDLGSQAETSGRLTLSMPLTPDPEELLQRLSFRADITKIGPRTLERMLYALDPQEQNETIVQQRRLMGIGYPRNLRVAAAYGNLSVSGAVEVKGFQLDLPPVDRLAIANLPLKKQLTKPLAAVPGLVKLLDAASGSLICRDGAGAPGALRVIEHTSPRPR